MPVDPRQMKRWSKLIMKKYESATESKEFSIVPIDEDIMGEYYIMIKPTGGHYKGQTHILEFKSQWGNGNVFPFNPPSVRFISRIYHPNIMITNGSICVDILRETKQWSPQYDICAVISSIILLMDVPNNSSPYNGEAAQLFRRCEMSYKEKTKNLQMDHKLLDKIYDECFKPYDDRTKIEANSNLSIYLNTFNNINLG